jgi:hypothetical protein
LFDYGEIDDDMWIWCGDISTRRLKGD